MSHLLSDTARRGDVDSTAERYLEWEAWRREARWHPAMLPSFRVTGLEHLLDAHRHGGVLVATTHHGPYEGASRSVRAAGGPRGHVSVHPRCFVARPRPADRQYRAIVSRWNAVFDASVGVRGMTDLVKTGQVVLVAVDMPGSAEVTFAGRQILVASGVAAIATITGAPIIQRTHEYDGASWTARFHPPVHASDFADTRSVMQHLMTGFEAPILAIPEALLDPLGRWGVPRLL